MHSEIDQPVARTGRIDRVATITSAACAVHCAVMPIALPLLPLALSRVIGPGLEWGFAVTSIALGVASLGHSYRALHRHPLPLAGFVVGMVLVLLAKSIGEKMPALEITGAGIGAAAIMAAHLFNLKLRRGHSKRTDCPCPCHDDS